MFDTESNSRQLTKFYRISSCPILEITMLTSARRVATVTAVTVCDLFILTADNLNKTLEEFPEMRAVMEKVALNRLLRLREKVLVYFTFIVLYLSSFLLKPVVSFVRSFSSLLLVRPLFS